MKVISIGIHGMLIYTWFDYTGHPDDSSLATPMEFAHKLPPTVVAFRPLTDLESMKIMHIYIYINVTMLLLHIVSMIAKLCEDAVLLTDLFFKLVVCPRGSDGHENPMHFVFSFPPRMTQARLDMCCHPEYDPVKTNIKYSFSQVPRRHTSLVGVDLCTT
jgi:hypothetical protein